MTEIMHNPVFWVVASFAAFVALAIYLKLPGKMLAALDSRSAKIKNDLDAANALFAEAQMLLTDYQQKQEEYLKEAESMLAKAKQDADILRATAEKEMTAQMDARMKAAMERIALEEEKAVAEVRTRVVEMAMNAARTEIQTRAANSNASDSLSSALTEIERKIR